LPAASSTNQASSFVKEEGPKAKKAKLEESFEEAAAEQRDFEPVTKPQFKEMSEVRKAFLDFVSQVPSHLVPKLHKLIREAEKSEEENPVGRPQEILEDVIETLREKVPVSGEAPGEEIVFNSIPGVPSPLALCFPSMVAHDEFSLNGCST